MKTIFISGSDTGVGKTFFAEKLVRLLKPFVAGYKPIACGDREDAKLFLEAMNDTKLSLDDINPCFLTNPLAPQVAAKMENQEINFLLLDEKLEKLKTHFSLVLIEGAGGLLTPITSELTMRDLAKRWQCSVILVVPNRLGALSQARTVVECVEHEGLKLEALVLNPTEADETVQRTNFEVLNDLWPNQVFLLEEKGLRQIVEKLSQGRPL